MEVLNISKIKFKTLESYELNKDIFNTECKLFILDNKITRKLLKIFYIDEGVYFGNKLLTINSLINEKDNMNIDELVMPEKLVIVGKKVAGFSMPYINSENLQIILNSFEVPLSEKIRFLKEVGEILNVVHNTKPFNNDFYLSDIHEGNFIYDKDSKKIRVVDLDGCKIANNVASPIKYLSTNKNISNFEYKYQRNDDGFYIPNLDSEYFCFIMMILNTISHHQINNLSLCQFYSYLQYLRDLGVSNELLDYFNNLYSCAPNELPLEALDELCSNKNIIKAQYSVFDYIQKKKVNRKF